MLGVVTRPWSAVSIAPQVAPLLEKLSDPRYIPDELDIAYCKGPTIGITETRFNVGGLEILIVEVDRHTTKLREWTHYFQDVVIIIHILCQPEYVRSGSGGGRRYSTAATVPTIFPD